MFLSFFEHYFYKSLDNTNDEVKKLNMLKKRNIGVFTGFQRKGRGRKQREWESSIGDLACSFLIKDSINVNDLGKINLLIVNSVINILDYLGVKNIQYKWPNDIFIQNKKLAGILIETTISKKIFNEFVIGIGINFVPKKIKNSIPVISLSELNCKVNALKVFFLISFNIHLFMNSFKYIDYGIISKNLTKVFFSKSKLLTINSIHNSYKGNFIRITPFGELLIEVNGDIKAISYGEIL